MSKLQLPDVTLVMVETRELKLAKLAVDDCLRQAVFGDVLIVTNLPQSFCDRKYSTSSTHLVPDDVEIDGQPVRFHVVPDWPSKMGWSRAWWYEVPPLLRTRQTLNIQWDSWIVDPTMWTDEFLNYDYIGAPWWYKDGKNVGNGGFCLKSTRLARYIADRRGTYPCNTAVDDDLLCRTYRAKLEEAGFVWAPESVAHDFAYECCRPSPVSKHFGFHAMFNWPDVLSRERLYERLALAYDSPYIRDGYMMKAFLQKHPQVVESMLKERTDTR